MWHGVTPMELEEVPALDPMDLGSVHELGHGVVAEETGFTVLSYELWRVRGPIGVGGVTKLSDGPDFSVPEEVYSYLMVCLAGQEAEAKYLMTQCEIPLEAALLQAASASGTDLSNFAKFSKYFDASEAAVRRDIRRLISAHWSRITTGARKLKTRGRLKVTTV